MSEEQALLISGLTCVHSLLRSASEMHDPLFNCSIHLSIIFISNHARHKKQIFVVSQALFRVLTEMNRSKALELRVCVINVKEFSTAEFQAGKVADIRSKIRTYNMRNRPHSSGGLNIPYDTVHTTSDSTYSKMHASVSTAIL